MTLEIKGVHLLIISNSFAKLDQNTLKGLLNCFHKITSIINLYDLGLWPMTLKINRGNQLMKGNIFAKSDQNAFISLIFLCSKVYIQSIALYLNCDLDVWFENLLGNICAKFDQDRVSIAITRSKHDEQKHRTTDGKEVKDVFGRAGAHG